MAEARREEDEEGQRRELRDVRSRSQATDHTEKTKTDHLHSSQGPLSSLRAAIKRTRANSQTDQTRERRRPEITIVSAEPLASNSWFSGGPVVFPRPPQSDWSGRIQAVSQPPPSYDQVIHEKTQEEHVVKPTAAPRRTTCTTTTSATQTDPVREDTSTSSTSTAAPQPSPAPQPARKKQAGKRPQKPPRPFVPKPVDKEPVTETPADEKVGTNTSDSTKDQSESKSDVKNPTHTCSRSVTVHWDILSAPAENTPSSSHSERPVPLPRTKSRKKSTTEEVKVQTLVKLSENCDDIQSDPDVVSSNEYLKELLEAFSADNEGEENIVDQSEEAIQGEDAGDEMTSNQSQRNIRARIQAFESQEVEENVVEALKPEPRPRKATPKPPVASKPSVPFKPQLNNNNVDNVYQNVSTTYTKQSPTTAPKPLHPKKSVDLPVKEELETLFNKTAGPNRSRPSVLSRAYSIHEVDSPPVPPTPPVKPVKEALKPNLNINNHNSASITEVTQNVYVDSPTSHTPVKPQQSVDSNGASFTRQNLTRRPTTIRVPSKTDSFSDNFVDSPPPLPAQKPVGSLNTLLNRTQSQPILPKQDSFQAWPEPSLPPRPGSSKRLPPRPPAAKPGPGRPPPPGLQATGQPSASREGSPKPQAQKPHRKGPVLPPRPNPGHRLYNKYTFPLPHGIASFDHNGSNTGELSFQQNEVLLLLEEIDHNTFECQVGDTRGRVHKSRMKVINPLSSIEPQGASPGGSGGADSGFKVQATHDFSPEGPGELGLRAGDVVTMVEQVDSEWYRGTCRGSTGFFPANHVKVLSNSPKALPEKKPKPPSAAVSGPRCVARFDFEGENSGELSFCEGDLIQLKAFVGQDWAQGQIGASTGTFPLNFVEVIEDLPPPPSQQKKPSIKIPLPGLVASPSTQPEVAKPAQASKPSEEWMVALYDYSGNAQDDLPFKKGDCIQISQHIDAEWSCGRLNGREGIFPRAFVESSTAGQQSSNKQQSGAAGGSRCRAMFSFSSDCDEELSLQVGDIITDLESVDDEWFLGDLKGKRALVPKNYVQVL